MNNQAQNPRRGRGAGRGRGNPPTAQRGGYAAAASAPAGPQRPMNAPGAMPQPRMASVQGRGAGGDGPRAPNPNVAGRATSHREPIPAASTAAIETGTEAVVAEGRGGLRGKRVINEVIKSRPTTCVTKSGYSGRKINIQTNYFRVLKKMEWSTYQYRVDFSPEIDLLRARRYHLAQHKELFGGYIFDGTVLFCSQHLKKDVIELFSKNNQGETILIKVKYVGVLENTDIEQLQVLNLILRRAMEGLKLELVQRNFYDSKAMINLVQHGLEIWPGYTTSIRQHEQDILLCCEISHKVMRTDTLYRILTKCIQDDSNYQDAFKRLVVGSVVLTDYNNKTYRIDDVDFAATPNSTFKTKDGDISYAEYYRKRYNITIRDLKQPMLLSRPKERDIRGGNADIIMLVPELSRATGMTDEMRANFRLMKDMGEHTRLAPERRIERLKAFNTRLQQAKESVDVLNLWDMKLDRNLVEVPARVLPNTEILFAGENKYVCDNRADWTREFRNRTMRAHINMGRWIVVTPSRNVKEVQNFVEMCIKAARGMNMVIKYPRYEEMRDDRNGTYSQHIDNAVSMDPQLLMIVLVRKNEEKYSCVKKKCCVDRPIPSQVCVLNTIAPRGDRAAAGLMSIATKVVIQMNAKLGGAPWMVDMPLKGVMIVGFDVCHSAKDKNKSYGALVATMDMKRSHKYYSTVMQHDKTQELANEIPMRMKCALTIYKQEHNTLPERIMFYRDGVGDGQLHQVFDTEIVNLKKALDEVYAQEGQPNGCKLIFIVVSKRINTRYFANSQNPVPGTVVDDIITLPERYDFFLVSQSVRQGTVSPTSYNIIYDTAGIEADRIQIITYRLTHMYYNWSGTCRVPAVCQYAHKLAFLVAESIHRAPSNALEKLLYFL